MEDSSFTKLPDDVVFKILFKLEDDPRNWARLACVSPKLSTLIRTVCCRSRCLSIIPSVVADGQHPPGGWSSLHKIAVCCPGLLDAGVLLDNCDFGQIYRRHHHASSDLRDDPTNPALNCDSSDLSFSSGAEESIGMSKKRKVQRPVGSHLASGTWSLSREQGNKLLAGRFREDALYICDWPGCIHAEAKRSYMLFRGIFKNFKRSRVWRTLNDGQRRRIGLNCAYCGCNSTWDLQSAFCLRRPFGYHDDGEPVVRAYVCENGHVSGAWTHLPLYT